jgi:hypothetical protein
MKWEKTLKRITEQTAYHAAALWVDKPMGLKLINNQINYVYRFEDKHKRGQALPFAILYF